MFKILYRIGRCRELDDSIGKLMPHLFVYSVHFMKKKTFRKLWKKEQSVASSISRIQIQIRLLDWILYTDKLQWFRYLLYLHWWGILAQVYTPASFRPPSFTSFLSCVAAGPSSLPLRYRSLMTAGTWSYLTSSCWKEGSDVNSILQLWIEEFFNEGDFYCFTDLILEIQVFFNH